MGSPCLPFSQQWPSRGATSLDGPAANASVFQMIGPNMVQVSGGGTRTCSAGCRTWAGLSKLHQAQECSRLHRLCWRWLPTRCAASHQDLTNMSTFICSACKLMYCRNTRQLHAAHPVLPVHAAHWWWSVKYTITHCGNHRDCSNVEQPCSDTAMRTKQHHWVDGMQGCGSTWGLRSRVSDYHLAPVELLGMYPLCIRPDHRDVCSQAGGSAG